MPRTNKRTCSTCAMVPTTLAFEFRLPSAGVAVAMCCIWGEKRPVVVREGSGLEIPADAIPRLA